MSLKAVIPMATITMFVCLTEGGISRRSNTNKHRCLFVPFQSPLKHIFRVNLNVNMWKLSVVCLMLHRTPYPHHGQLSILVTKQQHVIKNPVNNRFLIVRIQVDRGKQMTSISTEFFVLNIIIRTFYVLFI